MKKYNKKTTYRLFCMFGMAFFIMLSYNVSYAKNSILNETMVINVLTEKVFAIQTTQSADFASQVLKKKLTYNDVQSRARDHLIMQFGYVNWANKSNSIPLSGFNRQFRIYGMYDFLIKGFPYMSVGIGVGGAWDNVYFKDAYIDISPSTNNTAIHFKHSTKKYEQSKITTFYFDIPLELRFTNNPRNYNRGFKFSLGLTYGFAFSAWSKGVKLYENEKVINDSKVKVVNSAFFNSSRLVGVAKIGWGFFHFYGTYQFTNLFNPQQGPAVSPYSFGIGINGL